MGAAGALVRPMLAALCLAGCSAAPTVPRSSGRPVRVMSMNGCTDQLVLALLPRERIASVTTLARDPEYSLLAARARAIPTNRGLAEDVASVGPDLVVASSFTSPAQLAMLRRLGFPMLVVGDPGSPEAIRRAVRAVAAAVGERAEGEALVAGMDRDLAELARAPGPPLAVAAWGEEGLGAPAGSLADTVLTAAGAHNVGVGRGGRADSIEALLALSPSLLVTGDPRFRHPGRHDDLAFHPAIARRWRARTLVLPEATVICGTPFIGRVALAIRAQLRAAAARRG